MGIGRDAPYRGIRKGKHPFQRTFPNYSPGFGKVLASTLDYLLQEGLVTRERFEEVPPRVEYSLTPIAKDFLREISYVIEWGQLHIEQIVKGRK